MALNSADESVDDDEEVGRTNHTGDRRDCLRQVAGRARPTTTAWQANQQGRAIVEIGRPDV